MIIMKIQDPNEGYYPQNLPCRKTSQLRGGETPCAGTAHRLAVAPMEMNNNRGPWYGCDRCQCLAQYQDFMDNVRITHENA
jgi:hypothetical protein